MKQHLGFQKPRAQAAAQVHDAYPPDTFEYQQPPSFSTQPIVVQQIQKQIVELQAQIAALSNPKQGNRSAQKTAKEKDKDKQKGKCANKTSMTLTTKTTSEDTSTTYRTKPKPWYCFRCGEDGHIATNCNDPPNPTLVSVKRNL